MKPEKKKTVQHQHLNQLREALLGLHKALIDSERGEYEKTFGPVESPHVLLRLLTSDPWFAWLHAFSQLIVAMDESIDGKEPVRKKDLTDFQKEVRRLLRPSEEGEGFGREYFESLQRAPDVVLAHAAVLKLLPPRQAKKIKRA
ncbi:MAG: hypothetical protein ABJC04_00320 [Verrucomicrobiota bacterium]